MKIFEKIEKQISDNPIILYMKGTPKYPKCGFSDKTVKILTSYNIKFIYIDVLKNQDIRKYLPKYANWPTFPQLWINGELIGGYDIIYNMYCNKELDNILLKNFIK
ncbi:Grx4 family monothiol glutaredoxin [Enterobacteriaceae endosymbiont of Plateumaris consimilis]|uniref:Grx4 family monothiol glutaredoxin n=1 Tax=Enterobacteriaceae endosymbiont of Plateumaris consimilis TaxID=2675794 RepID=UPI001448BA5E|nr:Grx4 family monothiol glutaredoxin [Enterobacteriaceae endosymbiont of Plateumaris consimilis]QJC28529.1 Grx4 family monothiol glutaredoxin [Enterobacteriaceae endosymbiont of Plateumaris consimilis]